jgi:hypothetical protein
MQSILIVLLLKAKATMTKLGWHPEMPQKNIIQRLVLYGTREYDIIITTTPRETPLMKETRWMGEGLRQKAAKAFILASYVPVILLADVVVADGGGELVFLAFCVFTIYLFNITGWNNDEIK